MNTFATCAQMHGIVVTDCARICAREGLGWYHDAGQIMLIGENQNQAHQGMLLNQHWLRS